jgi:flagellar basal body-associated protein FliL
MAFAIVLALVAIVAGAIWYLWVSSITVTFESNREDLLEEGPFKEWLFSTGEFVIFGRDNAGYFYVMAMGYLAARRIRKMAIFYGAALR